MGACCQPMVDANTRAIESRMSQEEQKDIRTNKLLFLGPGGSGKSTIFKQLQWLHLGGFSKADALRLKQYIYHQVISQMKDIIKHYSKQKLIHHEDEDVPLQKAISLVQNTNHQQTLTGELSDAIHYIWTHETRIKQAYTDPEVSKYQILDESTRYFWNDLDRLKDDAYVPNEADILNVRNQTTGVNNEEFEIGKVLFNIFDVGGQKSERKKWIHCFNEVHALVFVISLSSYNEMMYEDKNKNCMVDALELFDETINNKWFEDTHIILFLNKKDLFEKKIEKYPITECPAFDDFSEFHAKTVIHADPQNYDQTTQYIRHKFRALKRNKKKKIYTHLTYAMDRQNVDRVFTDVQGILTHTNLAEHGLMPQ